MKLTLLLLIMISTLFKCSYSFKYLQRNTVTSQNLNRCASLSLRMIGSSRVDNRSSSFDRSKTKNKTSRFIDKTRDSSRSKESKFEEEKTSPTSTTSATSTITTRSNVNDSPFPGIVVLEKGKARLFQEGQPLIYGGAVKEVIGDVEAGEEVLVQDHMGNNIGRGFFNPYSQYRVRMMSRTYEDVYSLSLEDLLTKRITRAIQLRTSLSLISPSNTAFRLVNGEGDRCGGLIIDVLGSTIVCQSSALWVETHKETIEKVIKGVLPDIVSAMGIDREKAKLIWRRVESRLKQDGYTGNTEDEIYSTSNDDSDTNLKEKRSVIENKIRYFVEPEDGQKTGFYCDQRDNRRTIQEISRGKQVLDLYCYSGGFGLNAAVGGAEGVICVDSSRSALDTAQENAKINSVDQCIQFVKADAVDYMKSLADEKKQFDIVICDPPKLAPTRTSLDKAKNKYIKINALAMSLVKKGGLLLTCTCSAAATNSGEFPDFIAEAARMAQRDVTVLSTTGAGADHPVHLNYREGSYLTAMLVFVS